MINTAFLVEFCEIMLSLYRVPVGNSTWKLIDLNAVFSKMVLTNHNVVLETNKCKCRSSLDKLPTYKLYFINI